MNQPPTTTPHLLTTALLQAGLPQPSPIFLHPILTPSSGRLPPLSSLLATTRVRLLNADITNANVLSPQTPSFPASITSTTLKSSSLSADIPCQILDIEDLSRSKWDIVESLESERKGETTKGREVIRVLPTQPEDSTQATQFPLAATTPAVQQKSHGPFKVLLQDVKGQKVYGFELKRVEKLSYPPGMNIGCKVILKKDVKVARGMVLLEPESITVLGGKIEAVDKAWKEMRENRLREAVGAPPIGGAR
ncbi:hypothetical protein HYALB_00009937 [Hymenoscyphus albidus]|uniref:RecQ-mediated genome instability protein 1 n=1 Tax=Hymenoscyphus albidus TaxID=595503 RepID=A0A9N9Q4P9_9HELO|nr:hypothetical protein HYALB_00009937 [Hymenoscyphus albidus]